MVTVSGTATSRGFVSGTVFLYAGEHDVVLPEYTIPESKVGAELARYREARAETRRQLEGVVADVSSRVASPRIFPLPIPFHPLPIFRDWS